MNKQSLLNEKVVDIARYLQEEYLAHGMLFLSKQTIVYDRSAVDIYLEEQPRTLLTTASKLEKFNKRYVIVISCASPTIRNFLEGNIAFNDFYTGFLSYILELERYISIDPDKRAPAEVRLAALVRPKTLESTPVVYKGKQMRTKALPMSTTGYEVGKQVRNFIYPYDLTLEAVSKLIAFERNRGTIIDTVVAQQPDDLISVYDQYTWVKKELTRRGIFIQEVEGRLSAYDNTWLNLDVPKTLERTMLLDKTNRGVGFESMAFKEKQQMIRKLTDLYYWGIENNGVKTSAKGTEAPDGMIIDTLGKITGSFAVSMSDIGIGPTAKEPENVEREDLSGATLEDLKHLIQKIFIQQMGATSVTFSDEKYDSGTELIQVRLRSYLFEVDYKLDEREVASLVI